MEREKQPFDKLINKVGDVLTRGKLSRDEFLHDAMVLRNTEWSAFGQLDQIEEKNIRSILRAERELLGTKIRVLLTDQAKHRRSNQQDIALALKEMTKEEDRLNEAIYLDTEENRLIASTVFENRRIEIQELRDESPELDKQITACNRAIELLKNNNLT